MPPTGALTLVVKARGGAASGTSLYSNPIEVVAWSRGFSRIEPPEGWTPFHNLRRIAIIAQQAQASGEGLKHALIIAAERTQVAITGTLDFAVVVERLL